MKTPQEVIDAAWRSAWADMGNKIQDWRLCTIGWVEGRIAVAVFVDDSRGAMDSIMIRFNDDSLTEYMTVKACNYTPGMP